MSIYWIFVRRLLAVAAALLVVVSILGCNTARGFGKDVQRLGEKISGK